MWAHSGLPGPLSEGNALVDQATQVIGLTSVEQAQRAYALHHLNSNSLRHLYKIPRETARQIVKECPQCPTLQHVPSYGVNPRGLKPNHLWQMVVTHIPSFGKLQYVHVTIDTFSGFIFATAQTGEAAKHIIAHCLQCFCVIGQPQVIKTDNGIGYTSRAFQSFCASYHIEHKTGIPYNPQGQGIVERAHGSLKLMLEKIKKGELYPRSSKNSLNHALFILNFLTF